MTWNELKDIIGTMSESDRAKTVYYREPYDKDAETYAVDVVSADEDLGSEVRAGDPFLQ